MITEVIIKKLAEDTTLQGLLDATGVSDCAVYTTNNFDDTVNKQINVSYSRGTTEPFCKDISDGTVNIHILVKDTISSPTSIIDSIANRVLALLDLGGTSLSSIDTVYWVQKIDDDWNHYDDIHFYEYTIVCRYVIEQ